MSFLRGTEEYYQKFIELQEKLRKSEEERLVLEMKFNEMVQITREEEQGYYRKLRNQYKRFLEEDRRRQERNERIMRVLERIESRAGMLAAKTERFELLRQQYLAYLKRISSNPRQDHESIQPPQIPQEIPTIIEEKADLYDHPAIQKAIYGDRFSNIGQGADLYEHPVIKKALYGVKEAQKSSPKLDVVNQYLRSLSTPISGEEVLKTTRSSEKLTHPREFSDSNESNSYRDQYSSYKSNAGSIADHIINSINSKPKLSSPYHSKYDSKSFEKEKIYKPRGKEVDPFCTTRSSPSRFKTGMIDDVEVFKYPNLPRDSAYSLIGKDEWDDKEKLRKAEVRFRDPEYKSNDVPSGFSKAMQEDEIYSVKDYLPRMNHVEEISERKEDVTVDNVEEEVYDDKKTHGTEQYEEPTNTEEYQYKNNEEMAYTVDNDNANNIIENRDYVEQTLGEDQALVSETELEELEATKLEEKQEMDDEKDVCDEIIETKEISRTIKDDFNKYNTECEAGVTEDIEYNKHQEQLQQAEPIQNVKNNEESENVEGNNNQSYYQEYDDNDQPLSYYGEHDKPNVEYEENIGPSIVDNKPQTDTQPDVQQNNEQGGVQYNEQEHAVQRDDNKIPELQSTHQNNQYEESEHLERNQQIEDNKQFGEDANQNQQSGYQDQPISQYVENAGSFGQYERNQPMEYDNNGQPLMTYDNHGQHEMQYADNGQYNETVQPILQYDENGQPIVQYDENGQPIMMQYDENGQPIVQYDADGQPIMMQYNENGQPIMMQYDEHGRPVMQYDENGQPIIMQYDQNGQPVPQYDEHGQHMLYDESGQPMVHYDENGQPVYQYGQGEEYYQDNRSYEDNTGQQQHYEEPKERIETVLDQTEMIKKSDVKEKPSSDITKKQTTKNVDGKEAVKEAPVADSAKKQTTKNVDAKEAEKEKPAAADAAKKQTSKNSDVKEATKEKPSADAAKKQTTKNADAKETEKEKSTPDGTKKKAPSPKTSEKKPNVMDMLDTDTESVKQDTKVSNDSDFDFSNS